MSEYDSRRMKHRSINYESLFCLVHTALTFLTATWCKESKKPLVIRQAWSRLLET